ncbi:hypothetical protein ACOME3_000094 [Neoechinorhynchus agilis]
MGSRSGKASDSKVNSGDMRPSGHIHYSPYYSSSHPPHQPVVHQLSCPNANYMAQQGQQIHPCLLHSSMIPSAVPPIMYNPQMPQMMNNGVGGMPQMQPPQQLPSPMYNFNEDFGQQPMNPFMPSRGSCAMGPMGMVPNGMQPPQAPVRVGPMF